MAANSWVITDLSAGLQQDSLELRPDTHPGVIPPGVSITKVTRRGGLSTGVDEVRVDNGRFQFSLLPTRGMGLWKGWINGQVIGWQSPVRGPVHPQYVAWGEPSGLGWLDGFDEWICRCGALSNGAPEFNDQGQLRYPLHGRLANLPAHYVEIIVQDDLLSVRGIVTESRFHFQQLQLTTTITTRVNQPGLEIVDEVKNLSAQPGEMQMLYHCNFGAPLLAAGAEVVLPSQRIVPRNRGAAADVGHWSTYREPTPGLPERVYFHSVFADDAGDSLAVLKDARGTRGASLTWNARALPYFSQWKNEAAVEDGYVTGLEPGTNFPNPRTFEGQHGRVVELTPGGSHTMKIGFEYLADAAAVTAAERRVHALRGGRNAELVEQPTADWCAPEA